MTLSGVFQFYSFFPPMVMYPFFEYEVVRRCFTFFLDDQTSAQVEIGRTFAGNNIWSPDTLKVEVVQQSKQGDVNQAQSAQTNVVLKGI